MCGIAGVIGQRSIISQALLQNLSKNIAHRGPDDEGIELIQLRMNKGSVLALVHRRLAIIDLSESAHQPMKDSDTGNWIIYNGEIYNFKSIRKDLQMKGIKFRSQSDTEVILKAYSVFGIECLNQLYGMFAFAIWDAANQKLVLARDRLGIKPLYYYIGINGLFLFASEIRALLTTDLVPKKVDPLGLESYLAYGAVQAPLTMVKGINCLLPSHYLEIYPDGRVSNPTCYWSPPFLRVDSKRKERHLIDKLGKLLREIISQHLVSDVPLGVFLSGGIDSTSITILMNRVAPESVRTFSVVFSEREFSEAPYSRLVAKEYSRHHTEILLSEQQLFSLLPSALRAIDQPTVNGINVYVISKVVREAGIKAVLSGQGGDEIFGGYDTFRQVRDIRRYSLLFKLIPKESREKIYRTWMFIRRKDTKDNKILEILKTDGDVMSIYTILRELFSSNMRQTIFPYSGSRDLYNSLVLGVTEELKKELENLDPVNQTSLLELRTYLANTLLRDGDFMSMAHALEVRVPFLDHRLIEFLAKVPGRQKLDRMLPKPLLLKTMKPQLPSEIYRRPKTGFTFPWEFWLRNQLRSYLDRILNSPNAGTGIGLAPEACQKIWHRFLKNDPKIKWPRVWALFVLIDWCERMKLEA